MTLGDVIAQYRKDNNMSMDAFASLSGISKGYISMLERNKTHRGEEPSPSIDMYKSVAKVVGMDADELIRAVEGNISLSANPPPGLSPIGKGTYVPLYGRIACGAPILAVEDLDETAWMPEGVRADFALTCCGDSMINARIFDGDIVYIRQQDSVDNGEIAAVVVQDEEVTLKRFYYYPEEGRLVLRAENPTVKAQEYEGEELGHVRVLGKAVKFLSVVR
jgi:repressor LexA